MCIKIILLIIVAKLQKEFIEIPHSNALDVAIYECPNCGKIELYNPEKADQPVQGRG